MTIVFICLGLFLFSGLCSSVPLLLLVSFDGFRWDYPDIYNLPNLNSIVKRNGVRLTHVENSFATVTFPSHYTIVTGLFEETHGIVANAMYDPVLNASVTINTMNDTKWWSQNSYSQPIWVTNQLGTDSKQRRSGVIAWPGSNTPINGHLPFKYLAYQSDRTFDEILDQMFQWFHEPEETRINFGIIYFSEPDQTGHNYGPISQEMNQTLQKCDQYIGKLLKMIDNDLTLKTNLNVILTSDHGMHEVEKSHRITLENIIDKSLFSAYGGQTLANIFVHQKSDIEKIYLNLSKLTNYEVYRKSEIPYEYHYQNNVRIGDILIVGKVGYEILLPGDDPNYQRLGDHGYDNRDESMHPIFYAFGPSFRNIDRAKTFRNVDIYPLMSYVLGLPIRVTNGSLDNVKHILVDFEQHGLWFRLFTFISQTIHSFFSLSWSVLLLLLIVTVIGIVISITACRHSKDVQCQQSRIFARGYSPLDQAEESTTILINNNDDEDELN